jgi:hypothetical protein
MDMFQGVLAVARPAMAVRRGLCGVSAPPCLAPISRTTQGSLRPAPSFSQSAHRQYHCCPRSRRTAPPIRPDMIVGKDRGHQRTVLQFSRKLETSTGATTGYSIMSSARASILCDTLKPSALAVWAFIETRISLEVRCVVGLSLSDTRELTPTVATVTEATIEIANIFMWVLRPADHNELLITHPPERSICPVDLNFP